MMHFFVPPMDTLVPAAHGAGPRRRPWSHHEGKMRDDGKEMIQVG